MESLDGARQSGAHHLRGLARTEQRPRCSLRPQPLTEPRRRCPRISSHRMTPMRRARRIARKRAQNTRLPCRRAVRMRSRSETKPAPPMYRPPSGATPKSRRTPSDSARVTNGRRRDELTLSIDLRVLFNRGGSCSITLLPRIARWNGAGNFRKNGARSGRTHHSRRGLIQDVPVEALVQQLQGGIEWRSSDPPARWILPGRYIFVLGERSDLRGYVTQSSTRNRSRPTGFVRARCILSCGADPTGSRL